MPGGQGDRITFPFGLVVQSCASTEKRHLEPHPVFRRKYESPPRGLGETWPQLFSICHPAGSATTLSLPEDTDIGSETWKEAENPLSSQQGLDVKVDGEGRPCGALGVCTAHGVLSLAPQPRGPLFPPFLWCPMELTSQDHLPGLVFLTWALGRVCP